MSEDQQKRKLIELVDNECKKRRFTLKAKFAILVQITLLLFIVGLLVFYIKLLVEIVLLYSATLPEEARLGYLLSQLTVLMGLLISMTAFIISSSESLKIRESTVKELSDWYYKKLSKKVEDKSRPLLKALVKMKCSDFSFCYWKFTKETNLCSTIKNC